MPDNNDIKEKNCDNLFKQRESLDTARLQMSNAFDKYLLTFSTGTLILSINFTNTIVGNGINQKNMLAIGWIFLILAILSVLFSFNFSEYAHERQMEIVDAHIRAQDDDKIVVNEDNCWIKVMTFTRWLAIFAFVSGIIILTIFYFINLK